MKFQEVEVNANIAQSTGHKDLTFTDLNDDQRETVNSFEKSVFVSSSHNLLSSFNDADVNLDGDALALVAERLDIYLPKARSSALKISPQVSTEARERNAAHAIDQLLAAFDRLEPRYEQLRAAGSEDPLIELGFTTVEVAMLQMLRDEIDSFQ